MLGGLLYAMAAIAGATAGAVLGYALACLIAHEVISALARRTTDDQTGAV